MEGPDPTRVYQVFGFHVRSTRSLGFGLSWRSFRASRCGDDLWAVVSPRSSACARRSKGDYRPPQTRCDSRSMDWTTHFYHNWPHNSCTEILDIDVCRSSIKDCFDFDGHPWIVVYVFGVRLPKERQEVLAFSQFQTISICSIHAQWFKNSRTVHQRIEFFIAPGCHSLPLGLLCFAAASAATLTQGFLNGTGVDRTPGRPKKNTSIR